MIKNDIALTIEKNSEFNRAKALQIVESILDALKDAIENDAVGSQVFPQLRLPDPVNAGKQRDANR